MREEKIKGLKVKMYDSIDELPIVRFHKYNKFMLIDSGIGSDLTDIDTHVTKISKFISSDDKKNAVIELENMRQLLYMITEELSPKHLAFATLVHSINGNHITDISDDGLKKVIERLNIVNRGWFSEMIESLKKKMDSELAIYFPTSNDESKTKEYYDQLKRRILLQCKGITTGEDVESELEEVDNAMIMFFKPQRFQGGKIEVDFDKNFEDMCLILSQNLSVEPKKMNVLEFYNSFEYLKKSNKGKDGR
jgi:hypothetical protein